MKIDKEFTLKEKKEKRDVAITVRLPRSVIKKIKNISTRYNYSQSEVLETLVVGAWKELSKGKEEQ